MIERVRTRTMAGSILRAATFEARSLVDGPGLLAPPFAWECPDDGSTSMSAPTAMLGAAMPRSAEAPSWHPEVILDNLEFPWES